MNITTSRGCCSIGIHQNPWITIEAPIINRLSRNAPNLTYTPIMTSKDPTIFIPIANMSTQEKNGNKKEKTAAKDSQASTPFIRRVEQNKKYSRVVLKSITS